MQLLFRLVLLHSLIGLLHVVRALSSSCSVLPPRIIALIRIGPIFTKNALKWGMNEHLVYKTSVGRDKNYANIKHLCTNSRNDNDANTRPALNRRLDTHLPSTPR